MCCLEECTAPKHYDNCPECYGFGKAKHRNGRIYIATAIEALRGQLDDTEATPMACNFCGSTLKGIPV